MSKRRYARYFHEYTIPLILFSMAVFFSIAYAGPLLSAGIDNREHFYEELCKSKKSEQGVIIIFPSNYQLDQINSRKSGMPYPIEVSDKATILEEDIDLPTVELRYRNDKEPDLKFEFLKRFFDEDVFVGKLALFKSDVEAIVVERFDFVFESAQSDTLFMTWSPLWWDSKKYKNAPLIGSAAVTLFSAFWSFGQANNAMRIVDQANVNTDPAVYNELHNEFRLVEREYYVARNITIAAGIATAFILAKDMFFRKHVDVTMQDVTQKHSIINESTHQFAKRFAIQPYCESNKVGICIQF